MAKKRKEHPGETLEQLESAGDRLAEWIGNNPALILGTALGVLVIAGAYGFASSARESARSEASDALSKLQSEFRVAMGADPDSVTMPEPANPETARSIRREYLDRFRELASEHEGTVGASLAWIDVGQLELALGNAEEAISTWSAAAAELGANDTTRALLLSQIAAAQESRGRWVEAAESHEAAAAVEGYPLRHAAMAEAARCFAEAREADRAIAALERVESEAPDQLIPDYTRARVAELRAGRGDG